MISVSDTDVEKDETGAAAMPQPLFFRLGTDIHRERP